MVVVIDTEYSSEDVICYSCEYCQPEVLKSTKDMGDGIYPYLRNDVCKKHHGACYSIACSDYKEDGFN